MTTKPPDPKITALRLIAVALDDDNDAKTDHGRLILNQIDNDGTMREVICEISDLAASLLRAKYGIYAYLRTLQQIQTLVTEQPEQRTPPRPLKDRPTRKHR